ncbi:MAG: dihydroorotase [Catalinimonas sp.]
MNLLIADARLLDPRDARGESRVHVLIRDGVISELTEGKRPAADRVIDAAGRLLSPGWVDLRCWVPDPGFEHRDDVETATRAAAAGGWTAIATLPNTMPVTQTKDLIVARRAQGEQTVTQVLPLAAVSVDTAGERITEMLDLHHHGAAAFSDGLRSIQSADLLLKTLLYLQPFGGLLMNRAEDTTLTRFGTMHEGIQSTMLGLRGRPSLAEETRVARDLDLLAYAGGRLHFSVVSTARTVAMIRAAKARGLDCTCDVAAHQLAFDDTALSTFDTNYKVNPPFRRPEDRKALREGLADGTIDAIVSDHQPHEPEGKALEFDGAEFGITGLETAFAVANEHAGLTPVQLVEKFAVAPRRLLGLPEARLAVGQPAALTLFDPDLRWTFDRTFSRSRNTPFLGKEMKGRALAVVRGSRWYEDAAALARLNEA